MNAFKVGDRVKVSYYAISELAGQYGTVRNMNVALGLVEVEMLTTGKIFFLNPYLLIKVKNDKHQGYTINNPDIRDAIKNVIFNDPATIVFWMDGTKTVVKAEYEDFDPEKGLAMAISKKMLGNKGRYYEVFKKWLPKEDPEMDQMLVKALFDNIMAAIGRNTEEHKCSTCARFDDENMSCMISNCEKYSRYVKKDAKEESKRNPVQEAYDKLIGIRDRDEFCDFDELIGLLGEALDS